MPSRTPTPTAVPAVAPTPEPTPSKSAPSPTPVPTSASSDFYIHYDGFSLLFNCKEHSAHRFNYTLTTTEKTKDKLSTDYGFDLKMSKDCQQNSIKGYASGYDRGDLADKRLMTDGTDQSKAAHYMTNVAPQVSSLNQGMWALTVNIEACFRNVSRIYTWGGVVYTSDTSKDHFTKSHGIRTPAYWWKVILTKDKATNVDKVIAWYFPNEKLDKKFDEYLVSVADLEAKLNDNNGPIPIPDAIKATKAKQSWVCPK
ncbi:Aste57867_20474 [Aphanomyces stellatus]|uniref:Aste57867_20474 protein n=1 Tax=Aphanomyces stellatus TaxID=120398 RepID=A0A485LFN3_9STRA|nr:hypothetical protein As57867_020408 [Aphanomyces stellatus]VFT97160.1 Aste57867_20474 [Aphanomyces stellatus]